MKDPRAWGATALVGLFVLASLAAIAHAKALLVPVVLALLLNFLLRNPVRWLERVKVPKPLGAGLLLVVLVGALGVAGNELREPAMEWLANAPRTLDGLERKIGRMMNLAESAGQQPWLLFRTVPNFGPTFRPAGPMEDLIGRQWMAPGLASFDIGEP